MQSIIKTINRVLSLSFLFLGMINVSEARATDLSALDFNGNLIGKVIPDGAVINFNNDVIGYITADGLTFNNDKNLIGGIVPQGVAISTNNQILGKVNNDGSVTTVNDSFIGKVLPNGLVVNNNYDVIGSVISPGLVYDDAGDIIGRVSGDGKFYDLSGSNTGFVTSSGYVYTMTNPDRKATLAGKLISSKIIISSEGNFLGGIAPDGKVIDLEKNYLGRIHANGFVYNDNGKSIGQVVENGYAFDLDGKYLGVVSYNGEIIDQGTVVAQAIFGNRVINKAGNVIGFTVNTDATFNDLKGKYLGRIVADGVVVKGREIIGKIGTSGNVINTKGEVIGFMNHTGPIFDYLGDVKANAAVDGSVISLEGMAIGYMQNATAYNQKEKEIGTTLVNKMVFDNHNNFLGMSGINSKFVYDSKTYKISPYGYVFDDHDNISGRNYNFSGIYAPDGNVLTEISSDAIPEDKKIKKQGKLVAAGYFINEKNKILGKVISEKYATDFKGTSLGYINSTNMIANQENNLYAKILPNGNVVSNDTKDIQTHGRADNTSISISINGDYLGSNTEQGIVRLDGDIIGQISSNQYVVDNQGSLYGKTIPFGAVVDDNCNFIGVVAENGKVRTGQGAYLGMVLANNQVINDNQDVIGYIISPKPVIGKDGEIIGIQSAIGTVYNYKNQNLGCQDIYGKIRNSQKNLVGQILTYSSAMDFDNKILGYTDEEGKIINGLGEEKGKLSEYGSVQNQSGKDIGILFKYTVAFDENSIYMGRINSEGQVISDDGNIIGKVNYNGLIKFNDKREGFALYDLYVYNNMGKTIGYISKNGRVYSIMGDLIGTLHKGFVIDKKQNLIARGARDYDIRDKNRKIIGYLQLDGKVINDKNIEIGTLAENGGILDSNSKSIATADPLQYYHRLVNNKNENAEDKRESTGGEETSLVQGTQQRTGEKGKQVQTSTSAQQGGEKSGQNNQGQEEQTGDRSTDKKQPGKTQNKPTISDTGDQIEDGGEEDEYEDEYEYENEDENKDDKTIGKTSTSDSQFSGTPDSSPSAAAKNENNRLWWENMTKGMTISPYDDTPTIQNVGAGGGIGPGGRYNPRRAAKLNQLFNNRRQNLAGRKIMNTNEIDAYTGWQDDWGRKVKNTEISSLRVDMSNMITADKAIPAVMSRPMISFGKAPITAIVERNIYGMNGRNVVIPAGSRIIGTLQSSKGERKDEESGGIKIDIIWRRIVRPDGIMFNIDGSTGDAQGRGGGALGYVDEQMLKKYTLPLMATLATSGMAYMMAANKDSTNGSVETSKQQAANDARENFLEQMDQIQKDIMKMKQKLQAVTYVPAGTRIIVYPNVDLWLKTEKIIDKKLQSRREEEAVPLVAEGPASDKTEKTTNKPQENNTAPLVDEGPRNNNNNNRNYGNLPPASADGSGMKMPEEKKEDEGLLELFPEP